MSEPEALEGEVVQVPFEIKIAARTLRAASYQLQGEPWDEFHKLADQVEKYWDGGCCPICQEVWCDDDCPLAELRAKAMREQR